MKRVLFTLFTTAFASSLMADTVVPHIPEGQTRFFISGDVWSNPMEDWQVQDGRIVNINSGGDRNVVSLTSEMVANGGDFAISANIERVSEKLSPKGWVGYQIGLQGNQGDYRENAIYGVGLPAGITAAGQLFIGELSDAAPQIDLPAGSFSLHLSGTAAEDGSYTLVLEIMDADGASLASHQAPNFHGSWIEGQVAITASSRPLVAPTVSKKPPVKIRLDEQRPPTTYGGVAYGRVRAPERVELKPLNQGRGGHAQYAFSEWKIAGEAVKAHPERTFGPIWWTTYTVDQDKTLRLLVQMAPVIGEEGAKPEVQVKLAGETYTQTIDAISFTALFEIPLDDASAEQKYTVHYGKATLDGLVQALPTADAQLTIASLSCNDSTGFPHAPLVENVTAHEPDVITFHGDQIYEGIGGYGYITDQQPNVRANICYLRKYAMHGWIWRDLLTTRPSITIPDDHDVMHGNIWGVGGKAADMSKDLFFAQDSGGYKMSAEFVNMVHRTQTRNLPLADDQPTCKQDITTYHTRWVYGPLDMVVIADRQFKSAPRDLLPEAQIHNGWVQNLQWDAKTQAHVDGAQLLGEMQEEFLADWAESPIESAPFRLVISQSPWLAPQTLPETMHHDKDVPDLEIYPPGGYAPNDEPKADFDTNGWPQDRQSFAVAQMKKAGAIHIVGDQHLGTTGRYGVDGYGDGAYWIATPAIANVWPRRWMPQAAPVEAEEGWPRWKGGFEDGFGNKFTMIAVANPEDTDREPARLHDRAAGYTITRYNPSEGTASLENWPYLNGPQRDGDYTQPYPGWPVVVKQ